MDATLILRNAALGFGARPVLHVHTLEVPRTGLVCMVGPSGAGKSTLLEAIGLMSNTFLMDQDEKAELVIEGERFDPHDLWVGPMDRLAKLRRELFSFIFQSTNLMPNFTVGENIRMAHQGFEGDAFAARVSELLDRMDLPQGILARRPHELSGGQRQRVAFIRALAKDFVILLADEPTGNLDQKNATALFSLLRSEVTKLGRTALVVTHHMGLAEEFGDRIWEVIPTSEAGPGGIRNWDMAVNT